RSLLLYRRLLGRRRLQRGPARRGLRAARAPRDHSQCATRSEARQRATRSVVRCDDRPLAARAVQGLGRRGGLSRLSALRIRADALLFSPAAAAGRALKLVYEEATRSSAA